MVSEMEKHIVLLGAPGSGKGTQARLLSRKYHLSHLSTGDILREERKKNSDLGRKAAEFMNKGLLVPDDIILEIVKSAMEAENKAAGYVLDGFPRTLVQAEKMDEMGIHVSDVVLLEIPDEIIVQRITGRRSCPECGKMYHLIFNPPENDERCDVCGIPLVKRKDDMESVIRNRLAVYARETAPLIEYYKEKTGVAFHTVDGGSSIEDTPEIIFKRLVAALGYA